MKFESTFSVVVLPEPVPPLTTIEIRDRTQARMKFAMSWFSVPKFTRSCTLYGTRENFRIVMLEPCTASGGITMLTREPSGRRASTIGDDSSTRRPIRATIRSITRRRSRSLSKTSSDWVRRPRRSAKIVLGPLTMISLTSGSSSKDSSGPRPRTSCMISSASSSRSCLVSLSLASSQYSSTSSEMRRWTRSLLALSELRPSDWISRSWTAFLMRSTLGTRAAIPCGFMTRLDIAGGGVGSPFSGFSGSLPLLSLSTSSIGSSWIGSATRGRVTVSVACAGPPAYPPVSPCWGPNGDVGASLSVSKTCVPVDSGGLLTGLALGELVEQAVLGRPDGRLGARAQVELGKNIRNMVLHGLVRKKQISGDLLVGLAMRRQPQDTFFLIGEGGFRHLVGAGGHLADPFQDFTCDLGIKQRAALGNGHHGVDQGRLVDLFQQVSGGAGHDRLVDSILVGIRRQHDDFAAKISSQDLAAGVDATTSGHADVEQYDIGPQQGRLVDGVLRGGRFADDADAWVRLEDRSQP